MFTVYSVCLSVPHFYCYKNKHVKQTIRIQWRWMSFSIQPLPAQLSFPLARIDPFLTDRLTSPQGHCRNGLAVAGSEKSNVELWNLQDLLEKTCLVKMTFPVGNLLGTAFFVDFHRSLPLDKHPQGSATKAREISTKADLLLLPGRNQNPQLASNAWPGDVKLYASYMLILG